MINWQKLSWIFTPYSPVDDLPGVNAKDSFLKKLEFINFNRLRIISLAVIPVLIVLIIINISVPNVWSEDIIKKFITYDISLLIYLVIFSIISLKIRPENHIDIRKTHYYLTRISLVLYLIWTTLVSLNENSSTSGFPTYIITTIFMAIIFAFSRFFYGSVLILGMTMLIIGTQVVHSANDYLISNFTSITFMSILAFVVSRVIYRAKEKDFAANWQLFKAKENLDKEVKRRTEELSIANSKLREEISARLRYEKQLVKEVKRAEESDRLKSSFLANMSHEIRTPLNGIIGFTDLIRASITLDQKLERYTDIIHQNSHNLLRLIDDIIDISMIQSKQLKIDVSPTQISHIFYDAVDFFETYKTTNDKAHILLTSNFSGAEETSTNTDSARVQQILYNLLKNAFKFTLNGSVSFTCSIENNNILFVIEDTGIGIPTDKVDIVFEQFRQGDDSLNRKFGGTGLGLSISKGISDKLACLLWLDNTYEQGARFCYAIPVITEQKELPSYSVVDLLAQAITTCTILLFSEQDSYTALLNREFKLTPTNSKQVKSHEEMRAILKSGAVDIIITTPSKEESFYSEIKKALVLHDKGHIPVFSIIEDESQQALAKSNGVNNTYNTPVNLYSLVNDILQQIQSTQA